MQALFCDAAVLQDPTLCSSSDKLSASWLFIETSPVMTDRTDAAASWLPEWLHVIGPLFSLSTLHIVQTLMYNSFTQGVSIIAMQRKAPYFPENIWIVGDVVRSSVIF